MQNKRREILRKELTITVKYAMAEDDLNGIFGADFGFDSDDGEEKEKEEIKEKRTFQSEEDFLRQKREWTPKVENREVSTDRFIY